MTLIPRGISPSRIADLLTPHDSYHSAGGVMAMGKFIKQGEILVQHKHKYDHLSILASGTIIIEIDGVQSTLVGPQCITVKANAHHGVKALTDSIWYCIHTEFTDAEVLDAENLTAAREVRDRLKGA